MKNGRLVLLLAWSAGMIAGLSGCLPGWSPEPSGPAEVEATGTVVFVELEGGFYGILADDGGRYLPRNLPSEFRSDGLRVRFRARILKDVATLQMWGTPVEILEIERLDNPQKEKGDTK